jgi:inosine-uridine nucleoside N-ribohydrolase
MDRTKLLLDTDIGTDIDDAVCLAYLLSQPRCDLLGITTVTGEAEKRAMLASALCRHAGRDVPIYPGAAVPLILPQKQLHATQAEALGKWDHQRDFPRGEAIEFMRRTVRNNPGEVVLLAIGPLTNIGLLFATDAGIPPLLKGLVMMCGRFLEPVPAGYGPLEWNALCDAHATSIVYRSPVPVHQSIGLDVTSKVFMDKEAFRTTFRKVPLFTPIMDWAEIWFRDWPGSTFHDPLAAATVFQPDLCTYQQGTVNIHLADDESRGLTRWTRGVATSPHRVADSVNPSAFFRHYIRIVQPGESA